MLCFLQSKAALEEHLYRYIGDFNATDDVPNGFVNDDVIEITNGFTVGVRLVGDFNDPNQLYGPSITNNGTLESGPGSMLRISGPQFISVLYGTVNNDGLMIADAGTLEIDVKISQSDNAALVARNGGRLMLDGMTNEGSIEISNATLAFGGVVLAGSGPGFPGGDPSSPVMLSGNLDLIDLGRSGFSLAFDESTNDLTATTLYRGQTRTVADIHLSGSYSASDFSVDGTGVLYNPHQVELGVQVMDTTTSRTLLTSDSAYDGPVAGMDYQYVNTTADNLNITATTPNMFIRGGSGMDGIDVSQVDGNNILDGGGGSDFLTGGTGDDTFYVDARAPAANAWSTIVNLHAGDNVTLWGLTPADFTLDWIGDTQGAGRFTGLTGVAQSNTAGQPEMGITLTDMTMADLTNGKLTFSYGTTPTVNGLAGSNYLTIHAV